MSNNKTSKLISTMISSFLWTIWDLIWYQNWWYYCNTAQGLLLFITVWQIDDINVIHHKIYYCMIKVVPRLDAQFFFTVITKQQSIISCKIHLHQAGGVSQIGLSFQGYVWFAKWKGNSNVNINRIQSNGNNITIIMILWTMESK